ncbi:TcaA NTF2-like domain-containing protein [Lysinibacillus sp. NPDC093216]|uniref:TcaA NTF2-like domain-containing protein n=1 Tax=Lysinibacillus sp. NPDC093216 TaxID=3390576 RepID=UPI003D035DFC
MTNIVPYAKADLIESFGERMRKKVLILGATALLLTGCENETLAEVFHIKKTDVKSEKVVTKQQEKIVPEVKVVGENGIGAGVIIKKEDAKLYILTNGALVASKPAALVQFNNDKLMEAEVHYISTADNIAILEVPYNASVKMPTIYNGELNQLAVYVDSLPHIIKKYSDSVAAYYIDAKQNTLIGSPVLEAENGELVGIYFKRMQNGVSQPFILPYKDIVQLLDDWISGTMKTNDRLTQSKNLNPYIEHGDKEAVQQAIEQYGKNIFAYNADEIKLFLDTFYKHLKAAVDNHDASVMKPFVSSDDLQSTLDNMVANYASKQAKIRFYDTSIKNISMKGQNIVVRAKIEYVLTNSAGQEALTNSMMVYEINKNEQGEYKLIRLTTEE